MKTFRKAISTSPIALPEDAPEGSVLAVISTFNTIDSDGDVLLPGSIPDGTPIKLCQWGHNWGGLPVGKGVLHVDEEKAVFEGQFFLNTAAGRDSYETVKQLGDLQEWSWGFSVPRGGVKRGVVDGQNVRLISATVPYEVSPVMVGANYYTSTLDVKGATPEDAMEDDTPTAASATPPVEPAPTTTKDATEMVAVTSDMILQIRALIGAAALAESVSSWDLSTLMCCLRDLESFCMGQQFEVAEDAMGGMEMMSADDREQRIKALREVIKARIEALRGLGLVEDPAVVPEDEGLPYAEHGDTVLRAIDSYLTRSRSLASLRAKEGRALSQANRDRLKSLLDNLSSAASDIQSLLDETDPAQKAADEEAQLAAKRSADANRERRLRLAATRAKALNLEE